MLPRAQAEVRICWLLRDDAKARGEVWFQLDPRKPEFRASAGAARLLEQMLPTERRQAGRRLVRVGVLGKRLYVQPVAEEVDWRRDRSVWPVSYRKHTGRIGGAELARLLMEKGFGPGRYPARVEDGCLVTERPPEPTTERRRGQLAEVLGVEFA